MDRQPKTLLSRRDASSNTGLTEHSQNPDKVPAQAHAPQNFSLYEFL